MANRMRLRMRMDSQSQSHALSRGGCVLQRSCRSSLAAGQTGGGDLTSLVPSYTSPSQVRSKKMTYEIRKSTTKMLECLGPAGEHIWRSKLQGCWGMMPGGQGRG